MTIYRNSQDPQFLMAAALGRQSLQFCASWCDFCLSKMDDPLYAELMDFVTDWHYEKQQALDYQKLADKDMTALENSDKSTPEERRAARISIAQIRSWAIEWDKGQVFRDKLYGGYLPPTLYDAYFYTSPTTISNIPVPCDLDPWQHPFDDDPVKETKMPPPPLSDRESCIVVYAALVAAYGEFSPQAEDWAIKHSNDPDMWTALEQTVILVRTVVPEKGK